MRGRRGEGGELEDCEKKRVEIKRKRRWRFKSDKRKK